MGLVVLVEITRLGNRDLFFKKEKFQIHPFISIIEKKVALIKKNRLATEIDAKRDYSGSIKRMLDFFFFIKNPSANLSFPGINYHQDPFILPLLTDPLYNRSFYLLA